MNCQECRDELAACLEGLLDAMRQKEMESHLAECLNCQIELHETRKMMVRLACDGKIAPSVSLETAVMDRILLEQTIQLRRQKMRKRIRVLGISGATAAAVAVLLISSFWLTQPAVAEKAAEVMAQGAEAVPNPSTVHIVAKMRTLPNDNFSMIGAEYDFVPVEIWKQFGDKTKWRVEKPGRVAAVDGTKTVMLIKPDYVVMFPQPSPAAFDTHPLLAIANVQDMITQELRSAQARGWDLKLTHETTGTGEKKLLVTVESKSGVPADDYIKNKFLDFSDMRRVYRFDANTKLLEGFDAYLHQSAGDVLILSVERIEYNQPIDPTVFTVNLPENARYYKEPEPLPDNEKYGKMTPEQAARAFFEACAKEDWDEVAKFETAPVGESSRKYLGGLQIIHIGIPFQSAISLLNGDWFVPYEIKLKDGTIKKWNLALRPYKTAKRYIIDGGI